MKPRVREKRLFVIRERRKWKGRKFGLSALAAKEERERERKRKTRPWNVSFGKYAVALVQKCAKKLQVFFSNSLLVEYSAQ